MTLAELKKIAYANVERHLGDCFEADDKPSAEEIYEEMYTLALDALIDTGLTFEDAGPIAHKVAKHGELA